MGNIGVQGRDCSGDEPMGSTSACMLKRYRGYEEKREVKIGVTVPTLRRLQKRGHRKEKIKRKHFLSHLV